MINNFIAYKGVAYIRGFTAVTLSAADVASFMNLSACGSSHIIIDGEPITFNSMKLSDAYMHP